MKDAPRIDADGPISHTEENQLYTYYGLSTGGQGAGHHADSGPQSGYSDSTYRDRDTSVGRHGAADDAAGQDAMTRSEQRLVTDTRTEEAGKARLRKYVVTEEQQVTVPVQREEVRLQREPITDAKAAGAYDGPEISEAEHEVTLHAERPVVDTETVPVERVRLGKETVHEKETVSGEVRKEQIELDDPDHSGRR